MFNCQHWEAVASVRVELFESSSYAGYYTVTVTHRHKGTDVVVTDTYDALSWPEATSTSESAQEAARPGYRHTRLQALQDRLWPTED